MIGFKRYIRPGLAVSVIGHLAALIVGLFFVGANAFHAPPPEAMVVEVDYRPTPFSLRSAGRRSLPSANPPRSRLALIFAVAVPVHPWSRSPGQGNLEIAPVRSPALRSPASGR
jgi:hypothetical protein